MGWHFKFVMFCGTCLISLMVKGQGVLPETPGLSETELSNAIAAYQEFSQTELYQLREDAVRDFIAKFRKLPDINALKSVENLRTWVVAHLHETTCNSVDECMDLILKVKEIEERCMRENPVIDQALRKATKEQCLEILKADIERFRKQ